MSNYHRGAVVAWRALRRLFEPRVDSCTFVAFLFTSVIVWTVVIVRCSYSPSVYRYNSKVSINAVCLDIFQRAHLFVLFLFVEKL